MTTYEIKARDTKYSGTLYDIHVNGKFDVLLAAFPSAEAAQRVIDLRSGQ